jgi:hypothetical protein
MFILNMRCKLLYGVHQLTLHTYCIQFIYVVEMWNVALHNIIFPVQKLPESNLHSRTLIRGSHGPHHSSLCYVTVSEIQSKVSLSNHAVIYIYVR